MDERKAPRHEGPDRIGEILLKADLLTREQLREALDLQRRLGGRLGHILIDRGFVDQEDFAQALAQQLGLPCLALEGYVFDPKVASLLPRGTLEHHRIVPLQVERGVLRLAVTDPFNEMARHEVARASGCEVRMVLATSGDILGALHRIHGALEGGASLRDSLLALRERDRGEAAPAEVSEAV